MRISATHRRDVKGFQIDVSAQSDEASITNITTTFDAMLLASDNPNANSYSRCFRQVGGWTPGANHTTAVVALDDKGNQSRAVDTWTD